MRRALQRWLAAALRRITPKSPTVDQSGVIRTLAGVAKEAMQHGNEVYRQNLEFLAELAEAQQMCGAGPWGMVPAGKGTGSLGLREANPILNQGAYGDIELALQNVEWRREINLSWLEFSRWGIQQIILISRLYYIKNPLVRRLIDVCSVYVFGRGVEVSSSDETANAVLKDFFERNKKTLGQNALCELEKRKYYDGNLFFCFFADTANTGQASVRTIDAIEIQDIITDPNDTDTPWFYRRNWTERAFDTSTGVVGTQTQQAWYPALGYEPNAKPAKMGGYDVMWGSPVLHRKCGAVAKWHFGCPLIYPALDWAKAAKGYLESCLTLAKSHAQIAWDITTKGGQQAIEGMKAQLGTTVGPSASLWDMNPPAVDGSVLAHGPGTTMKPMMTRGSAANPEEVRQYKLMCAMVVGVPETFLADVSTGNLATATTLDRPTELVFLEKQEAWIEDLTTIALWVLEVSKSAAGGALRESRPAGVKIIECARRKMPNGRWVYEAKAPQADEISVRVNFPAIREGDIPQLVNATVQAMTLNNKGGQVIGIDEKAGVRKMYDDLGIEDGDELAEAQYPEGEYDPDRTKEILPAPIPKAKLAPGGEPQASPNQVERALKRLGVALKIYEAAQEDAATNGHVHA